MVLQNRATVIGMFGAVLASFLFFVNPSHAEVAYKNIYVYMIDQGTYHFDLNNDGVTDFSFTMTLHQSGCPSITAIETPARGNGAESTALQAGTQIGPNEQFTEKALTMASLCGKSYTGPWPQSQKRYLGLVFLIDGQPHYGWAAVELKEILFFGPPKLVAVLTGYAYETVEGMPINAGQTQ